MKDNIPEINVTSRESEDLKQWLLAFAKTNSNSDEKELSEGDIEKLTIERIKLDRTRNL